MTDGGTSPDPKLPGRNNRLALLICIPFFVLVAVGFAAYAVDQHQDYSVRTSPPDGRTTEVTVDEVVEGSHCARSTCSPEYTLAYVVDGETHTTPVRKAVHEGDVVHAFEGSDGHWYVTEDPGFGNGQYSWVVWGAFSLAALALALVCLRALRRMPKPGET